MLREPSVEKMSAAATLPMGADGLLRDQVIHRMLELGLVDKDEHSVADLLYDGTPLPRVELQRLVDLVIERRWARLSCAGGHGTGSGYDALFGTHSPHDTVVPHAPPQAQPAGENVSVLSFDAFFGGHVTSYGRPCPVRAVDRACEQQYDGQSSTRGVVGHVLLEKERLLARVLAQMPSVHFLLVFSFLRACRP